MEIFKEKMNALTFNQYNKLNEHLGDEGEGEGEPFNPFLAGKWKQRSGKEEDYHPRLDLLVLIVYCKEGTITFVELMDWGQAKADHHGYEDAIETGEADAIYVLDVVKTAGNLGNFHAGGTPLDFEECEIITTFFDDNGKLGQSIKPQNR